MRKFAIRLLTLAIYGTAVVALPLATPTKAAAESSKEIKKHKKKSNGNLGVEQRSSSQGPSGLSPEDRKASY
jgi:hypothetical protein